MRRWVWVPGQARVVAWKSGLSPPPPTVDGQPRMTLQYQKEEENLQNGGAVISIFLAVFAFGVIVAS